MENNWQELKQHFEQINKTHLKTLLQDEQRNKDLLFSYKDILLDLSHEKINQETIKLLKNLAEQNGVLNKYKELFQGQKINSTEKRAVLHTALRGNSKLELDGKDVNEDIQEVLQRIKEFSNQVRSGAIKGFTGKNLENVVIIGIGGSYLSIEFVYEALRSSQQGLNASKNRKLRFLANVDPVDFTRAVEGLDVEKTLVVVNSKTFTTAETILNAKTVKNWILEEYKKLGQKVETQEQINSICNAHLAAASTNIKATGEFGISQERVFGFWDFVGGRFSVWCAVGVLPLALHFGYDQVEQFLAGGRDIDEHLQNQGLDSLPVLLGLIGFYNTSIGNHSGRAILPYAQSFCKFVTHIQQLDMECNGKRVNKNGETLNYECTGANFGEPGTNSQHSFFQLLHQGRVIPAEFIGFIQSQQPLQIPGEKIPNHQELMSNFFSQPDALAVGKTAEQVKSENVASELVNHKVFPGDRPSLSFLFKKLDFFTCGQILALYEHRTIVEGFLWDVNSFDQWGVELGKQLAKDVRGFFQNNQNKTNESELDFANTNFNSATSTLIKHFVTKQ